jgi:hypothetical protein
MTPDVIAVEALPDYRLALRFANGEQKTFEMKPYLDYPMYRPLRDQALFAKALVDYGTVVWSQDIDMAPETLYLESSACT